MLPDATVCVWGGGAGMGAGERKGLVGESPHGGEGAAMFFSKYCPPDLSSGK